MYFEILGEIQWTETIALGRSIRELRRLNRIWEDNLEKAEGSC